MIQKLHQIAVYYTAPLTFLCNVVVWSLSENLERGYSYGTLHQPERKANLFRGKILLMAGILF